MSEYEAWPDTGITERMKPGGFRVLLQMRAPRPKSSGGLILPDEVVDNDKIKEDVGKVIAIGPGAFQSRATGQAWPGAPYCKEGDFVVVPKFGATRREINGIQYGVYDDENILLVVDQDMATNWGKRL